MSVLFCLDANVFITAWYRSYPPRIFGPIWKGLANETERIGFIRPVYDEIDTIQAQHRHLPRTVIADLYPLRNWIDENPFRVTELDGHVEKLSIKLEMEYEVGEDTKGAGENDIRLIAYSMISGETVVSLEVDQKQAPTKRSKYKIPIICREQGVRCIGFVELLDELGIHM